MRMISSKFLYIWYETWTGLALQAPKNDAPDVGESTHAELLDYELTG